MYPLNQLKTLVSCGRDPARSLPFRRGFLLIPLILVSFVLCQQVQSAVDSPDPGIPPVTNTADGSNTLSGIAAGAQFNSAFGFDALLVNLGARFNTGCGAGTLLLNTADEGTAVGAGALLSNTSGVNNTAVGAFALFSNGTGEFNNSVGANSLLLNTDGSSNNALGESALFNNTIGSANTAVGDVALARNVGDAVGNGSLNTAVGAGALFSSNDANSSNAVGALALAGAGSTPPPNTGVSNNAFGVEALESITQGSANVGVGDSALLNNATGSFNTAVGDGAGIDLTSGDDNIYIGDSAGAGVTSESGTIRIGSPDFVTSCFVAGITGVAVTGVPVVVDGNGQLGVAAAGSPMSANELLKQQHVVQNLKATTERQAAVIALQEGQIKALTAGLKQQADQIQKVSAQLEMIRPTPRVVENR